MISITPSTKLKAVSVHKIAAHTCPRYYYWTQIRNLDMKFIRIYYWYGSVLGAGWEAMLMRKKPRQVKMAMDKEHNRFTKRYICSSDDIVEMKMLRSLIEVILEGAERQPMYQDLKMDEGQDKFCVNLKESNVKFVGTRDGKGWYRGKYVLLENKCIVAGMVNDKLFNDLQMDMQVNGYTYSGRLEGGEYPTKCVYCVFKKTQKRMKKQGWKMNGRGARVGHDQTPDEYVQEIKEDLEKCPDKYYDWRVFTLGKTNVDESGYDIENAAAELEAKYKRLGVDGVLDYRNWRKDTSQCNNYGGCEMRDLCSNPPRARQYMGNYIMREMRYEQEKNELQK